MTDYSIHVRVRMDSFTRLAVRAVLAFTLLLAPPAAMAQSVEEDPPAPESQPTTAPTETAPTTTAATTTTTAPADEKQPDYLAVVNGRIHTITGGVVEGTILSKDGVIVSLGDVRLPDHCQVIDARGFHVYPGLVAANSVGLLGGGRSDDTTDLFNLNMQLALASGITTTLVGETVAKLSWGSPEKMVIRQDAFISLNWPSGDPLRRAELRADLERVRAYLRDLARHQIEKQRDKDAKEPDKEWLKGKYENYRRLLTGEAAAMISADRAGDLVSLAELARHFDFRLVIRGAFEGWTVADRLTRADLGAIVTPRNRVFPDQRFNRQTGTSIENAAILQRYGVTVAVVPQSPMVLLWGVAGRDMLHLNMEAAFAVRGGMSNDDAIRTITIDAARLLGVDDRVGSIEIGKDADLIICSGDLLHYMTLVHHTIVNGRHVYDKARESFYAHVRPDGLPAPVEFDDQWPRPFRWSDEDLAPGEVTDSPSDR